jgi:pSer/pThr/pTyr-binding forkhead associated (FHA) protein
MRLVVKQGDHDVDELQFGEGPIYIGRQPNSQVLLPDGAVSRQHAVIFNTQDGKWVVEDLDSANKTYLNDQAIHKAEIKTGDVIRVMDFTIDITLEDEKKVEKSSSLEDTLTTTTTIRGPQIIIRKPNAEQAPPIRFPAERAANFLQASEAISKAKSMDEMVQSLLNVLARQFGAFDFWCALRDQTSGPMTCHAGKKRDGQAVEMDEVELSEKISEAIEKDEFLLFLFSRDMTQEKKDQIRSIVIAPIISQAGCYGALYANNTFRDDHYSLSDLDYLMLLGFHTAAILEKL